MKIGIDARFVGPQGTGLGKYTEKLILNLGEIDSQNQYAIFLRENNWQYLNLNHYKNFKKVLADIPWYSLKEQLKMPEILANENLDILHIPHFNVPIFYKRKFVVTIHDLIHHQFTERAATTKNPIIFQFKRLAYRKIISHAIYKSQKIIVPTNFIKEEVIKNFKISPGKIAVTYEAAEEEYFINREPSTVNHQPFLIYVGNAYPHKNLERLLQAFKILVYSSQFTRFARRAVHRNAKTVNRQLLTDNLKLIIVCPRDVFYKRLEIQIQSRNLEDHVELRGYLPAKELVTLFQKAKAYVFPSLSEGFGIPGLNAMASGLPVVCSNIPTLKEVYGNAALYFDPNDSKDIAQKIRQVLSNDEIRSDLIKRGKTQVQKYSWRQMVLETLKVYKEAV